MPHFLNIQMKGLYYVVKFSMWVKQCHKPSPKSPFFPRASERRVLLKVGVCYTSSHRHIFTSWMVIFTSSHLHIFTSSHLHIFTSSHLLIFSLSLSCPRALWQGLSASFFFSLLRPRAVPTRHRDMATLSHEMRFECQKLNGFCAFGWSGGNPFVRNEVRV